MRKKPSFDSVAGAPSSPLALHPPRLARSPSLPPRVLTHEGFAARPWWMVRRLTPAFKYENGTNLDWTSRAVAGREAAPRPPASMTLHTASPTNPRGLCQIGSRVRATGLLHRIGTRTDKRSSIGDQTTRGEKDRRRLQPPKGRGLGFSSTFCKRATQRVARAVKGCCS
jgi:hypothetical protein